MYHVNPITGEFGICHAKSPENCPFGCENHSENYEEIQIKADKINKKKNKKILDGFDLHDLSWNKKKDEVITVSNAIIKGEIDTRIKNINFENVSFNNTRFYRYIENFNFNNCDFSHVFLGDGENISFENCTFQKDNHIGLISNTNFNNCDIDNIYTFGNHWKYCNFNNNNINVLNLTYAIEESDLTYEELEDIIANEKIEPGYMDKMIEDEADTRPSYIENCVFNSKIKNFYLNETIIDNTIIKNKVNNLKLNRVSAENLNLHDLNNNCKITIKGLRVFLDCISPKFSPNLLD